MKSKIIITPKKPIIVKDPLHCIIKLNKNQVNYGNLKSPFFLKSFEEKTNRHITIVGEKISEKIGKILNKFSSLEKKKKLNELKTNLKKLRWRYVQRNIYFVNEKRHFGNEKVLEHRRAYIRMIEMPDIDIFYNKLNILLKTRIPTQIPHITLFVNKGKLNPNFMGIAINSKVEFKKLNPKKFLNKNLK